MERARVAMKLPGGTERRVCLIVLGPLGALVASRFDIVDPQALRELERRLGRLWPGVWSIDAHVPLHMVVTAGRPELGGIGHDACEFLEGGPCYVYGSSWGCREWTNETSEDEVYAYLEGSYEAWLTDWRRDGPEDCPEDV